MNQSFKYDCNCSLRDKALKRKISIGLVVDKDPMMHDLYVNDLHPNEQDQLARHITQNAKNSFVLGRLASRTAIKAYCNSEEMDSWIDHGIFGYPTIENNSKGLSISIAHTEHIAFAACFDQKDKLGVDIETIDVTKNEIIETAMTPNELDLVDVLDRSKELHLIWSAKEALSKALQTGFLIPLELLAVQSIEKKGQYSLINFKHFDLFQLVAFDLGDAICSIAYPERCEIDLEPLIELTEKYKRANSLMNKLN